MQQGFGPGTFNTVQGNPQFQNQGNQQFQNNQNMMQNNQNMMQNQQQNFGQQSAGGFRRGPPPVKLWPRDVADTRCVALHGPTAHDQVPPLHEDEDLQLLVVGYNNVEDIQDLMKKEKIFPLLLRAAEKVEVNHERCDELSRILSLDCDDAKWSEFIGDLKQVAQKHGLTGRPYYKNLVKNTANGDGTRRKLFETDDDKKKQAPPDMSQLANLLQGLMTTMANNGAASASPSTGSASGGGAGGGGGDAPGGAPSGPATHNIASPAKTGRVRLPEGSGRGGADASRARVA